jgi:hypothetical protein
VVGEAVGSGICIKEISQGQSTGELFEKSFGFAQK